MRRGIQLSKAKIGALEMKRRHRTECTTCILIDDLYALMPTSQTKNIDQTTVAFISRQGQAQQRRKPIKLLASENSLLSILLFNNSQHILKLVQDLQQQLNYQQQQYEIHLFGYQIQTAARSNMPSSYNQQKTAKVHYSQTVKNIIYYYCDEDKDGLIGAAIRRDKDLSFIGIHQGGSSSLAFGILFTKEVINQLTIMLRNYMYPKPKFPLPTDPLFNEKQLDSENNSLQDHTFMKKLQDQAKQHQQQYTEIFGDLESYKQYYQLEYLQKKEENEEDIL